MERYEISQLFQSAILEASPGVGKYLNKITDDQKQQLFLVDLGINSIDYLEIVHIMDDKLNLSPSLDLFARTNCFKDIVDIFYHATLQH